MNCSANTHCRLFWTICGFFLLLTGLATAQLSVKNIPGKGFGDVARDRFIDAQRGTEARLAPTLLLTNEMGVTSRIREILTGTRWARITFHIPSARIQGAELLFYMDEHAVQNMRLLVNGHALSHSTNRKRMLTGGWDRHDIPADLLQDGENEFVFADSGVLYVDPGPGGRSSRSFDQGETWHPDALGPERNLRGEYLVRLRLQGYPPTGRLTSPVIDLADPDRQGCIAPAMDIAEVRLRPYQQTPPGTDIEYSVRSGSTPAFEGQHWTAWESGASVSSPGRYVQWQAILHTQSADQTPVLQRVDLEVELEEARLTGVELLELDQPEIAFSSYAFDYIAPHPKVTRLLEEYDFEEAMAAGETELEKFALLRDWVHDQWVGWQIDEYPYCPSWDPLEILEVTQNNLGFGMCTHYAAVFVGCAASLGYTARVLIIDHHCLAEIWSEELQKWILQDPGPNSQFDAQYQLDGMPLNALEVHQAVNRGDTEKLKAHKLPQDTIEPMDTNIARLFSRFGIPLRNNHLTQAEPAELEQGYQQYHWDGYLWWSEDPDPPYAEYSLQTTRPADFYWGVNQTRLYLQAKGRSDTLQVDLETVTPNFSHYLVKIDDRAWEERMSPLEWPLHQGENILAVRSVNVFDRQGRIARARVLKWPEEEGSVVLEEQTTTTPHGFALEQNFPNPFNHSTTIRFTLPTTEQIELTLFNLAGQQVTTLVSGERQAGAHTVRWDGRDDDGRTLTSGVYLYQLRTGDGKQVEMRKLLLLR